MGVVHYSGGGLRGTLFGVLCFIGFNKFYLETKKKISHGFAFLH